jgi:hypothetical protein
MLLVAESGLRSGVPVKPPQGDTTMQACKSGTVGDAS